MSGTCVLCFRAKPSVFREGEGEQVERWEWVLETRNLPMSQEDNGSSSGLRSQQSQNEQRNLEVLESRWEAEKRIEGSDPRCETLQGVTVWLLPKEHSPRWTSVT